MWLLVLGVQLSFSIRTNQPEAQTNRKHKCALLSWPLLWSPRKKYNDKLEVTNGKGEFTSSE